MNPVSFRLALPLAGFVLLSGAAWLALNAPGEFLVGAGLLDVLALTALAAWFPATAIGLAIVVLAFERVPPGSLGGIEFSSLFKLDLLGLGVALVLRRGWRPFVNWPIVGVAFSIARRWGGAGGPVYWGSQWCLLHRDFYRSLIEDDAAKRLAARMAPVTLSIEAYVPTTRSCARRSPPRWSTPAAVSCASCRA